jgi:hypothetical protein
MSRAPLAQSDSVSLGQSTCEIAESAITHSYWQPTVSDNGGSFDGRLDDVILDPCGPLSSDPD